MMSWLLESYRDYYWLLYTNWKTGGDKWKRRYAAFAMTSFLPTPYAIPVFGLIYFLHPLGLGREVTVYFLLTLIVVLGAILTYFICTKNDAYAGARSRAERLEGKELRLYQTKVMYKFMAIQLFLGALFGIPALYLM